MTEKRDWLNKPGMGGAFVAIEFHSDDEDFYGGLTIADCNRIVDLEFSVCTPRNTDLIWRADDRTGRDLRQMACLPTPGTGSKWCYHCGRLREGSNIGTDSGSCHSRYDTRGVLQETRGRLGQDYGHASLVFPFFEERL